jgi:serine/threonine-protein kinase HipA
LIEDGNDKFTAKFSATNETYAVMKAECRHASGGNGRTERCAAASGEGERQGCPSPRRFDRERGQKGWTRRSMVWTLTMFGLGECRRATPAMSIWLRSCGRVSLSYVKFERQ